MSDDELAAASAPTWEQHVRGIAEDRVRWVDRVSVQLFVEDYDRLREQNFALNAALHAQCDSFEDPAALRADLACALPVVEAAERVEALWSAGCLPHSEKDHVFAEFMRVWPELYVEIGAVVTAVRAVGAGKERG